MAKETPWDRIAATGAFQALVAAKRRFIIPATLFFLVYYFALPLCVGYAPHLMETKLLGVINLAHLFALSQFLWLGFSRPSIYEQRSVLMLWLPRLSLNLIGTHEGSEQCRQRCGCFSSSLPLLSGSPIGQHNGQVVPMCSLLQVGA